MNSAGGVAMALSVNMGGFDGGKSPDEGTYDGKAITLQVADAVQIQTRLLGTSQ